MIGKWMRVLGLCLTFLILFGTQALAGGGADHGGCEDDLRYLGILLGIVVLFVVVVKFLNMIFGNSGESKDR